MNQYLYLMGEFSDRNIKFNTIAKKFNNKIFISKLKNTLKIQIKIIRMANNNF